MNTYILNRAILNRDALDDNQRKAMFARLGGHGGGTAYGGSASKAADEARSAKQRAALRMGMGLGLGMIGGVGEASVAKSAVGAIDDLAWSAIFRKHGGGQPISPIQARRNELAAALRRDRELKRLDQHPELFRTTMYGNRRPMTDEQRRGMFATKAGGPNAVHSITTTPGGSTIQRTTETGFPRTPVQSGRVGGPPADQLRRPNPMEGIAPRQGRKGPEAPAAPHPGNPPPQGTLAYKQWLKDYGEWEKTLPGAGLRPWGSSGALDQPGMGAARDRAANVKATATSLLKKAAATRKNAVQTRSRGTISRLVLPDSLRR